MIPNSPTWFKTLDFAPVAPITALQVNSSIRSFVEANLQPDTVQSFINRFLPWLATQGKVNSVIAIFCDKLKEFAKEKDSPVLYVMTEDEIRIESEMIKRAEILRQELVLVQKQKDLDYQMAVDSKFETWYTHATDQALLEFQKPTSLLEFRSDLYKMAVKGIYFNKYKEGSVT